ncbi:outer membrane protein [Xanthobacter sp. TB0139]|uniref:outer membrane protein n=1 Tax=Xanthobacter sp. TB0139 TaxID=3459178 RepID=UPI004039BEFA
MLKRALLGVSALALLAGSASAADLAYRYPVKAEVVPVQTFSWSGFYIGGNLGWGWASNTLDYNIFMGPTVSYDMGSSNGFIGGFQAGYNYQFANNVVIGVEADIDWADVSGDAILFRGPLNAGSVSQKLDYFGTIRARLGYGMDRFLPYITGGAAWAHLKTSDMWGMSQDNTNWGWTIGAGMEYALTNNWTVKAEYLYLDFADNKSTYIDGSQIKSGTDMSTLKAGINYKF